VLPCRNILEKLRWLFFSQFFFRSNHLILLGYCCCCCCLLLKRVMTSWRTKLSLSEDWPFPVLFGDNNTTTTATTTTFFFLLKIDSTFLGGWKYVPNRTKILGSVRGAASYHSWAHVIRDIFAHKKRDIVIKKYFSTNIFFLCELKIFFLSVDTRVFIEKNNVVWKDFEINATTIFWQKMYFYLFIAISFYRYIHS